MFSKNMSRKDLRSMVRLFLRSPAFGNGFQHKCGIHWQRLKESSRAFLTVRGRCYVSKALKTFIEY